MENIIRILIVDDDTYKTSLLVDIISSISSDTKVKIEIECRTTFDDGMKSLKEDLPDLLILDMQFPRSKSSAIERDMGALFLKQMKEDNIKVETIVCSYGYYGYQLIKNNNCEDMVRTYIQQDSNNRKELIQLSIENILKSHIY